MAGRSTRRARAKGRARSSPRSCPSRSPGRPMSPSAATPAPVKPTSASGMATRRWRADVLVSDIGMPGEDGYEFIAKLRAQHGALADMPAVALTAYASREDRVRLLSAGFQAHVVKPIDPMELTTVVANLARTARR